jgi:hypothetical protein
VYATTRRILAYMSHRNEVDRDSALGSAQALSNFLQIDRHDFYKAARGLHSVANIPDPEDADKSQIQFYHASFQDFLVDPNRSGKFCISEQDALADIVPLCVYQCEVDAIQFHAGDGKRNLNEISCDSHPYCFQNWITITVTSIAVWLI